MEENGISSKAMKFQLQRKVWERDWIGKMGPTSGRNQTFRAIMHLACFQLEFKGNGRKHMEENGISSKAMKFRLQRKVWERDWIGKMEPTSGWNQTFRAIMHLACFQLEFKGNGRRPMEENGLSFELTRFQLQRKVWERDWIGKME